jgi:hypothetical protein
VSQVILAQGAEVILYRRVGLDEDVVRAYIREQEKEEELLNNSVYGNR